MCSRWREEVTWKAPQGTLHQSVLVPPENATHRVQPTLWQPTNNGEIEVTYFTLHVGHGTEKTTELKHQRLHAEVCTRWDHSNIRVMLDQFFGFFLGCNRRWERNLLSLVKDDANRASLNKHPDVLIKETNAAIFESSLTNFLLMCGRSSRGASAHSSRRMLHVQVSPDKQERMQRVLKSRYSRQEIITLSMNHVTQLAFPWLTWQMGGLLSIVRSQGSSHNQPHEKVHRCFSQFGVIVCFSVSFQFFVCL